jgi:class 3 adenylate cyclase
MPLFMDRHDLPGITAEQVAQAHLTDIQIESKYGVQFLAYWFDADHGQVFCLARAPRPEAMEAVHRDGHGLVPNEIIAVSEDDVFRFLGRVNDPVEGSEATRAFRTILFTDLKGSTSLLQEVGEAVYMDLLAEHDLIIRRSLLASRGREVKHTGDGIMASFDDVANALECSLAIQEGFGARMADGATRELRVRIGIAAGEPVDHNDDLFGSTVNLASRICGAADPGRILTSELVREMGTERGFSFGLGREMELKGFGRVRVFELMRTRSYASGLPERAGRRGSTPPNSR